MNVKGAWCVQFFDFSNVFLIEVQLDMRKRFRGNIVGSDFQYSPVAKDGTTPSGTNPK